MEFYYDEIENDVLVLAADGGLNSDTSAAFVQQIESLIDAGLTRIIVDCEKLEYISSYGLGVLIQLHGRMKKRGGEVKLCNLKGLLAQALAVTHLDRMFEIYPDANRARLAFRE